MIEKIKNQIVKVLLKTLNETISSTALIGAGYCCDFDPRDFGESHPSTFRAFKESANYNLNLESLKYARHKRYLFRWPPIYAGDHYANISRELEEYVKIISQNMAFANQNIFKNNYG